MADHSTQSHAQQFEGLPDPHPGRFFTKPDSRIVGLVAMTEDDHFSKTTRG